MQNTIVVGAQWGDEGKGKITHYLSEHAHAVVRFSGGDNAGHTVIQAGKTFKLHHLPSGIIYPEVLAVMANGMVVNPDKLLAEIEQIKTQGYNGANLRISDRAHLIMPYHLYLDGYEEEKRGNKSIGTTKRGIGPAYQDKVKRSGIRVGDLLYPEILKERIQQSLDSYRDILPSDQFNLESLLAKTQKWAESLAPYITDTSVLLDGMLREGKTVLFEGAQGALLDIDHGTYPFVTSSNCVAGNYSAGCGVSPIWAKEIIGVSKAYTTRVGTGAFMTEDTGETGRFILEKGVEYGTTTGRPRRCGWLDLLALRYAVRINGLTGLALTKLDVLSGLPEIKVGVGYNYKDKLIKEFPAQTHILDDCQPEYRSFPGWSEEITEVRSREKLPAPAREYLSFIEDYLQIPVKIISVGPEAHQTIQEII